MNNKTTALLTFAILIIGFHAPPAQAYYKTIEGINNLNTQRAIPSLYNSNSLFRSQRGRSIPSSPTTGDYSKRLRTSAVASDEQAGNSIRSLFGHANMSQNNRNPQYDNDQFNDSKIKLRTLVSHTCFEPVGIEIVFCKKRFGAFYNLKESILDGSVYEILVTDNPDISSNITKLYQEMVNEIKSNDSVPIVTQGVKNTILLRDRMQLVWDTCKTQTADHRAAARCYISRDRLYLDNSLLSKNPRFLH